MARPTPARQLDWAVIYRHALSRLSWCACQAAPEEYRPQYVQELTARAAGMAKDRPLVYLDVETGMGKQLVQQVASLIAEHPDLVIKSIEKSYHDGECGCWEIQDGEVVRQSAPAPAGTVQDMVVALKALSAMHPDSRILLQTDFGLVTFLDGMQQRVDFKQTPKSKHHFFRTLSMRPDLISLIDRGPLSLRCDGADTNTLFNADAAAVTQAVIFDGGRFGVVQKDQATGRHAFRPWSLAANEAVSFLDNLQAAAEQLGMHDVVRGNSGAVTLWGLNNLFPQTPIYASFGKVLGQVSTDNGGSFPIETWLSELPDNFQTIVKEPHATYSPHDETPHGAPSNSKMTAPLAHPTHKTPAKALPSS